MSMENFHIFADHFKVIKNEMKRGKNNVTRTAFTPSNLSSQIVYREKMSDDLEVS